MRIIFFVLPIVISNDESEVISNDESEVELGNGVCFISQVGGGFKLGNAMFLEDCDTLGEFETVPQPAVDMFNHFGVHPVVCCPQPIPEEYNEEYSGDYDEGDYLENGEYDYYGPSSKNEENIEVD